MAAEDRFADVLESLLDGPEGVWSALAARAAIEGVSGQPVVNDRMADALRTAADLTWHLRPVGVEFLVLPG
jgi:hypothetical protein